jgi:hypothetical protein
VLEEKVATRELPFHWTVDEDRKLSPVIVNVNVATPAVTEFGLSETMAGTGFEGGGGGGGGGWPPEPEPPPPQLENTCRIATQVSTSNLCHPAGILERT